MRIAYTPEQERLRQELRAYFAGLMTPEVRAALSGGDEAPIARVPVPFLTINTVGPTIMRYGTPEQKAFYLPKIAAGEIHFSIGYSEPEAGTDLAALRTV